jgi:CRP-like cAMP-binding protein
MAMRSKLKKTSSSVVFATSFTKEMEDAAIMIQGQFRRMYAMKRMAVLRRVKAKHLKLAKLNGKGWTRSDSMANMLQSSFIAKLCRRVVQRAAQFLTKAMHHTLCSEEVLRVLHTHTRTDQDLSLVCMHFQNLKFIASLDTRIQQLQACRYLHARTVPCGTTLFETGDVGDKLYIILRGRVECCVSHSSVKSADVRLQCGPGDSFGEQSLRGENEGRRDATVTTKEDCLLAEMERADYLRVTGTLTKEVLAVLAQPHDDNRRTLLQLQLCRNLFHGTHFFQELHFALLQIRCCDVMSLVQVSPGQRVYQQGKTGDSFFIVIKGTLQSFVKQPGENEGNGAYQGDILEGDAFGEAALMGKGNAARRRTETVVAAEGGEKVFLAKLLRNDYVEITNKIEKQVYKALGTPTRDRTQTQIELLFEFMRDEEFFKVIQLDGMRQQCCKAMMMQRVGDGEILFSQGDHGFTFHIVIRGTVRVVIDGTAVRQLSAGASFGELALLAETEEERVRTASIIATSDCLIATLTRNDFLKVHDRQELTYWISKFWVLTTTKIDREHHDSVHWKGYKKLHLLIAKTIKKNFDSKKDGHIARKDWVADLNRHNKGGDHLNHSQFCDALFELVDVWCEGCTTMLLYVEFLRTCFLNTTVVLHDRAHQNAKKGKTKNQPHQFQSYTMKKVNQVKCREAQLSELKAMHMEHHKKDEEVLDLERQQTIHDVGEVEEDMEKEQVDEPEPDPDPEPELEIHFDSSSSSESDGELSSTSEEEEDQAAPAASGEAEQAARSEKLKKKILGKAVSRSSMHLYVLQLGGPKKPEPSAGNQHDQIPEEYARDPYNDNNATHSSGAFGVGQWEGTQEIGYLGGNEEEEARGHDSALVWKQAGQKKHGRHKALGAGKKSLRDGQQRGVKNWQQAGATDEERYRGLGGSEKQKVQSEHHQWRGGGNAGGNSGFSALNQSIGGNQSFSASLAGDGYSGGDEGKKPVWRAGGRTRRPLPPRFELSPQTPPNGIDGSRMGAASVSNTRQSGGGYSGLDKTRKQKVKGKGKRKSSPTRESRPQTRGDPARRENSDGRHFAKAVRDTSDSVGPGTGKPNTEPLPEHMQPEPTPLQQRKIDRAKAKERRKDRRLAKREMKQMRAAAVAETSAEIAQAAKATALGFDFDFDLSCLPQSKIDEWLHLRSQLRNSNLDGRKRGIAWFQKVMRELNIVPPSSPDGGFSARAEDISGLFEEMDEFSAARQSTFKWKKSLRTYGPADAATPMIAASQRALGVDGEQTGKIVYQSPSPPPQPAKPADPLSQTLRSVAQTWASGEPWIAEGEEEEDGGPHAVDHSLVVALQGRMRDSVGGRKGPSSSAVSGMKMTQAEQDAAAGYRWPPREASMLPAI